MKNIIDGSNQHKLKTAHILTTTTKLNDTQWNCKQPSRCPLNGKCLYKGVIYQSTVTRHDNNSSQSYIWFCPTTFKTRFNKPLSYMQIKPTTHNSADTSGIQKKTTRNSV